MTGLTRRQTQVLAYLVRFNLAEGRVPTFREACDHLGIHSPNGLVAHVDALCRKGYLERGRTSQGGLALRVRGLTVRLADDDEGRRLSRALGTIHETRSET